MNNLTPKISSQIAKEIYRVRNEDLLEIFLETTPEFSNFSNNKQSLNAQVGGRILKAKKDGFGVCAAGGEGYENDLFLIFRGTTIDSDWVSSFKIGLGFTRSGHPVHLGFINIFHSMEADIIRFLNNHQHLNGSVHCIGHSLGGAIASLAAEWISARNQFTNVNLYTFGAPKPGFEQFSYKITKKVGHTNIHRVYHATDPVPMIPLFPFEHPPHQKFGHYISSSESIISAEAHDIKRYITSLSGKQWEELTPREPKFYFENAIEEWLKSKIIVDASSNKTWHWLNAALIYILKKAGIGLAFNIQLSAFNLVTLADKLAWLLLKAKDVILGAWEGSIWVLRLIQKAMQALGMAVIATVKYLTLNLIRMIITRLMEKTTEVAKKAVQENNRKN